MIADDSRVLGAAVLIACAVAILIGYVVVQIRRRRAHELERETVVPLVVFAPRAQQGDQSTPSAPVIPRPRPQYEAPPPPYAAPYGGGPYAAPSPYPPAPYPPPRGNGNGGPLAGAADDEARPSVVEGKTVRFYRPPEGTLQMLPGRLEIVEGEDRGQAIRFVRTRAGLQQVTFGRREGAPYEHIQLRAPTVSRQHARLDFERGHWNICNLSETNPVLVNGESLAAGHGARPLSDGDRIEMGEVVFRFRER